MASPGSVADSGTRRATAPYGGTTVDVSPLAHRRALWAPPDTATAAAGPAVPRPLPPGPYELRVAGVRVRMPGGEVADLSGLDLVLPPGRRAALIGGPGAGAAAAAALAGVLLRGLDYDGTITLGGVPLREAAGDDVRRIIGLFRYDAHAVGATLAAAPDAAPARALPAGTPIVIVEDPAPALGDEAADALLADLLGAAEGRTVLVVMHRAALPGATPMLRHVDEVHMISA